MININSDEKSGIFYFPPPFLHFHRVKKHEDIKKQLVPEIEKDLENNSSKIKNDWSCDVLSSFHFGDPDLLYNNDLLMEAIWDAYNDCIDRLIIDGWLEENTDLRSSNLSEIWYNIYKPGGNQEIHSHTPYEFSGIYILDDTEINGTVFWYESNTFPSGISPYMAFNHPAYVDTEMGKVGEGYIIIFPGSLPHYVPNVKNNKTSISFNFECNNLGSVYVTNDEEE